MNERYLSVRRVFFLEDYFNLLKVLLVKISRNYVIASIVNKKLDYFNQNDSLYTTQITPPWSNSLDACIFNYSHKKLLYFQITVLCYNNKMQLRRYRNRPKSNVG